MADLIAIADGISLSPAELSVSFIRSPGPGGQNVNKVSSAAQLRFDLRGSPSLPAGLKSRAARLAGSRLTNDGVIVITASESRSQPENREEAVRRLIELLRRAAIPPKRRVPTRPTLGSKVRRLATKTKRGEVKRGRASRPSLD